MANKKGMGGQLGGVLVFLGSLIYLYVVFTWYSSGAALGAWVVAASFLGPFVAALAIISAISLFFMSIGTMAGKSGGDDKMMTAVLWKFIMLAALTTLILTAGGAWFYPALVAFILTYLGAMATKM